ncbi:DUF418 domain-containing protein [Bacillus sp. ISL-40]|uniref:DUF418 domain-containing protein n=1 Tax=unclassified Bacillus (in: firmicutes) TaxID=185979 RepID=UPI001BECA47F|nr:MULTISPECIES: DUF418 domain-containing protein [unclassified Bacillus (in: firmicutes)]MBT2699552.1 DUF418 domain-containing protein [Bacillus sp. ISL-40]MBT2724105.1 DUF418 domain-containing protein [Bacillus sp. ISL-46]MBT2741166.1 DUF418 domain-containing protein [Bacillus sp. ISL-77]
MNAKEISTRIDVLDYLRGFALMGIILVNIIPLLSVRLPNPHTTDASYLRFLYLLVEGRFYTIFTFLFGVGFYIFISRANAKGKNGYVLFLRRILVLFFFGLVHVHFQPGEALTVYAICGLIILPFYKANKVVNLVFGMVMLLVLSLYAQKMFMVVPLMLLGIAAGQYRMFERISQHLKQTVIFTGIMFVLSVAGLIYQYQHAPFMFGSDGDFKDTQRFLRIGISLGPMVSALYVGVLILLLNFPVVRQVLSPLKSYGRMALTNYVSQTTFILVAGKLLDLFDHITYLQSLYFCLAIYVIQLTFSAIWLRHFSFGPLEWVWRTLTYFEFPPMRKTRV